MANQINPHSLDLENMSKQELVDKIQQLTAHVNQLKNLLAKETSRNNIANEKKPQRPFDFKKVEKRHIALKIAYFGWNYHGFAVQEDTKKTIEAEIFDALLKTRLIESRESSNYHRCGRTDKGVSAFCQVISLDVRTKLKHNIETSSKKGFKKSHDETEEIRYVHILNKVLPPDIRVIAWAPVDQSFSARFNCVQRSYKYYFPKGNLDIEEMLTAANYLVGEHDYRNFCKMDVSNGVLNYVRKIFSIEIHPLRGDDSGEDGYRLYELCIVGQAFLWHQVRCIVAILFLVGQKKESPNIVKELLNIDKYPCKPQYNMALELPLVLYHCEFESIDWIFDEEAHRSLIGHLQEEWTKHAIKSTVIKGLLNEVISFKNSSSNTPSNQVMCLTPCLQQKVHKPLLLRPRCDSLENRIEHFKKRLKIDPKAKSSSSS